MCDPFFQNTYVFSSIENLKIVKVIFFKKRDCLLLSCNSYIENYESLIVFLENCGRLSFSQVLVLSFYAILILKIVEGFLENCRRLSFSKVLVLSFYAILILKIVEGYPFQKILLVLLKVIHF